MPLFAHRRRRLSPWLLAAALFGAGLAQAQSEGGLYVAGAGFSFAVAAERGMAQNPGGRRFFLLSLPPETAALTQRATPAQVTLRQRVVDANGVLLVCQRDIDNGRLRGAELAAGVVAVRGWPPPGSNALPKGQRYFADENPANLPAANEALRTLRSTCS
jgi:hypothetical protein